MILSSESCWTQLTGDSAVGRSILLAKKRMGTERSLMFFSASIDSSSSFATHIRILSVESMQKMIPAHSG